MVHGDEVNAFMHEHNAENEVVKKAADWRASTSGERSGCLIVAHESEADIGAALKPPMGNESRSLFALRP